MDDEPDNETWLIDVGDLVAEREAMGLELSLADQCVQRLWFLDYCMRNAGDLANLEDEPGGIDVYLSQTADIAGKLGLILAKALFSLAASELEHAYFERFAIVCSEVRKAFATHV